MKASYLWIRDYLEGYSGTAEEMARQLTFSGTEVEDIEESGDDRVLDLGVTSNRVDCLCHLGLAREVAAVSEARLAPPACEAAAAAPPTRETVEVSVEDPEGCPRYTAQVIEGVRVGPSPAWLRERLETVGITPVNNVVDITNFVLLELNQPLHAFDLDRVAGARLIVRRAKPGERFRALNEREYALEGTDLVIADAEGAVALAGVMGGKESEVSEGTSRILLESAAFDPVSVRRTSRRHKLSTDSSFRFERGLDRTRVLHASMRAAALIIETCGGRLRSDPIDVGGPGPGSAPLTLRGGAVKRICGIEVPLEEIAAILTSLGCAVETDAACGSLRVQPPSWRGDLSREIDLVEEVIRIHGLDRLPERTAITVRAGRRNPLRAFREKVRDRVQALGLMEVLSPNFVSEDLCAEVAFLRKGGGLKALAPVRAGEGALRRSLLPSLLKVRKHNHDMGCDGLRFFEICNLHFASSETGALPEHVPALGCLIDGDLRDARGVAEALFEHLGLDMRVNPSEVPHLAPGAGAIVVEGEAVGVMGYPSRELLRAVGLKRRPVFFEVDLGAMRERAPEARRLAELPRFPSVARDLSLVMDEDVPFAALEGTILGVGLSDLETLSLHGEVYRSERIGSGRKNLVLRLVFRSSERTLKAEDVDAQVRRVLMALEQNCGARLRTAEEKA